MYELEIDRANREPECLTFATWGERDDFIFENWDDNADWWLSYGGGPQIEFRDSFCCY